MRIMSDGRLSILLIAALGLSMLALNTYAETGKDPQADGSIFTDSFPLDGCTLDIRGFNPYWPLVAGYRLLEGEEAGEWKQVLIITGKQRTRRSCLEILRLLSG
jgi:hypothetical protein